MNDHMALLIDCLAMSQIETHGCLRDADPMVQHLVKTSEHPRLRFRRHWIRSTALRQLAEGRKNQEKISDEFQRDSGNRHGASIKRVASIDPHLKAEMAHRHGTQWADPGFVKSVKEEAPKLFLK